MTAPVLDLEASRRRGGEILSLRQVCALLEQVIDEALTEPIPYHVDEQTGDVELDTLPPTGPIDGTWQPVPAVRRVWR